MRHRSRVKIDEGAVAGTGLEQEAAALVAASLQIDDHPNPRAPVGIGKKSAGAQHGVLFAVGE